MASKFLTPERRDVICRAVRAGATYRAAAEHAGVKAGTMLKWRDRGLNPDETDRAYVDFAQELAKATADAEVGAVAVIRKAMGDDWRAAAWFLERRHPDVWGQRQRTELTGARGGPVEVAAVDLRGLSRGDLVELERILSAAGGDLPPG